MIAAAALILASTTIHAQDWWTEAQVTMPQLVAQGYMVVGFDVAPVPNRIYSDVTAFRYMLQRVGADGVIDVATCNEKTGTGGMLLQAKCHILNKPAATP
jgi:hypothetical protein